MIEAGIEAFLAVVKTGGLSKAAVALHLTQPSVSKRLRLLESSIDIALFERGRGRKEVTLTPEGEAFVDIAERWAALYKEIQNIPTRLGMACLRIGGIAGVNVEGLNKIYRKILQHFPSVQLKVSTSVSSDLYEKVEHDALDIALVRELRSHHNVVVTKLYSQKVVGLCLNSSPFAGKKNVHPNELKPEYEILAKLDDTFQVWHNIWWDQNLQRIEVDSIELVTSLMHDANHWSLIPEYVANAICNEGDYACFTLLESPPERTCYKITQKNPRKSVLPALHIFDQCLETEMAKYRENGMA